MTSTSSPSACRPSSTARSSSPSRPRASTSCARSRSGHRPTSPPRCSRRARRPVSSTASAPATAGRRPSARSRSSSATGSWATIRSLRAAFMLDYAADPEVPLLWRFRRDLRRRRDRHRHRLPPRRLRPVHRRRDRDASRRSPRPSSPTARCRAPTRSATAAAAARWRARRAGVPDAVDVEDAAAALVTFAGGAYGVLETSRVAIGKRLSLQLEVYGSLGSAEWDLERPDEFRGVPARRPVHLRVPAGPREPGPPGRRPSC